MSTILKTNDGGAIHASDRADITITLRRDSATGPGNTNQVIGIAKTFSFNVNKPKTAIEVLSRRNPAGYARNPEDRTFTMNEVNVFERLENMSDFTSGSDPFIIEITYTTESNSVGGSTANSKTKVLTLTGVEFEGVSSSVDANGTEFTIDFTGRFRDMAITGDIDSLYQTGTSLIV